MTWDMDASFFHREDWCNTYPSYPTASDITSGSMSNLVCYVRDGLLNQIAFTPATLGTCTDAGIVLDY